ncbi:1-pyrroline-5-carboxylate dehydrogenase 1 [Peptococcaceae bacterium CEB3]|nr:1-pyrroline-5-carboxylate dehydrogenase 1 [Peptococcaceae bacterium CEB3]
MMVPFVNEALVDFRQEGNREKMREALASVKAEFGREYPLVIGGERIWTEGKIRSNNPSQKDEVVGYVAKAGRAEVEQALAAAAHAWGSWQKTDPAARAAVLFKAAALLRQRKFEFSAWMVYEEGKNWVEADADTAEAIDFMEYYGREMVRLSLSQPSTPLAGEDNRLTYIPLGVGAVIAPWNFPLAILLGMTTAAIVAGNTVLLKPASTAPVIAYKAVELLAEAGLPAGVVNYIPGDGEEIGDYLVSHPQIRFVSFTGSRAVGLRINELAAKPNAGQIWVKRVVAEMGGKDAVLVDEDADLDAAAEGIVASAFGFQGQKCSAGSRAIVHEKVYDALTEKIVARARALEQGPADANFASGPVIDAQALEKVLNYIEIGKKEGKLLLGGEIGAPEGYYVCPTIFGDVPPQARIAQEEIFGPVLALIKARDFAEGLEIFNGTEYGLTGSLYATKREHLEIARQEMHAGNLYFNRKCTGALVGAHPFGGFNMSGTDSKAGGPDYLLLFTQAKSVSEKF